MSSSFPVTGAGRRTSPSARSARPSRRLLRLLGPVTAVALVAAPAYAGPVTPADRVTVAMAEVQPPSEPTTEPTANPTTEPTPTPDPDGEPDATPTLLTLAIPATSRADLVRTVTATLTTEGGEPVPGRQIVVEVGGSTEGDEPAEVAAQPGWSPVVRLVTDGTGTARGEVTVPRAPASQTWRARLVQDAPTEQLTSATEQLDLVRWATTVRRNGPRRVVDGKAISQTWTVRTGNGTPVAGATVVVRSRPTGGAGRLGVDERATSTGREVVQTDARGRVSLRSRPRVDSRWVARVRRGTWHEAARATPVVVDNRPSGPVVVLPSDAPRPAISLPPQPRSLKAGPRPRVTRIPGAVWREMKGVTWHAGCPVGRRDLRLIRVGYWDYEGYARRGEIVVNAATAYTVAATFADIYRSRLPIRSMYRVDRFGYSSRVRGGDDFASMDAGNTSGFNCRNVVNYSALSPHAYGFAIDINTWENPYRSRTGIVPNTYWQYHSHPLVAWRSTSHPMIRTLYSHGWSWPYGLGDTQHFSAPSRGRYAPAARSAEEAEHLYEHGGRSDAAGHAEHTGHAPDGTALD